MARLRHAVFTWRSAIVESDLEPKVRHVALTISLHMSERGDSCFPGLDRLRRETGLGKTTIVSSLRTLEERGFLIVDRSPGGRGRRTGYTAVIPGASRAVCEEGRALVAAATNGSCSEGSRVARNCPENETVSGAGNCPEIETVSSAKTVLDLTETVPETVLAASRVNHREDVLRTEDLLSSFAIAPEDSKSSLRRVRDAEAAASQRSRPRDPLWEAFDELAPVTNRVERGRRNAAIKAIRESTPDLSDEERARAIRRRIRIARKEWRSPFTEMAIAANWARLGREEKPRRLTFTDRQIQEARAQWEAERMRLERERASSPLEEEGLERRTVEEQVEQEEDDRGENASWPAVLAGLNLCRSIEEGLRA